MLIKYYYNDNLKNIGKLCLSDCEIHIWIINWKLLIKWSLSLQHILTEKEQRYILKFRNYCDRMRSLTGKVISKMLLSQYIGIKYSEIDIKIGTFGKPSLFIGANKDNIHYNISHSGEFVVLTFTKLECIGIDIELIRNIDNFEEVALSCYTKEECNEIIKNRDYKIFFKYWTAKEAYVKALGLGLNKDFKSFSIRENKIIEKGQILPRWKIFKLKVHDQYSAHIVVKL
ncbi:4'-phosphopantetheinyl transferase family protein [Clostridium niameyense]|uniref:4'-phosphopantetheinyl transferase family protein n=1 Tax=Clostridium niameyense TaxID=1622073 RepID=UPI00067EDEE6|nr:4'-phosphopantetheinyl transferase superfamily protein [Clostridium niameyense]